MRYVITGGAGFIGSHLVEYLVRRGDEVVVLDNFSTGYAANLEPWQGRIEMVTGSVTDPAVCARAIRGADYVLHQAALPSVPRSIHDPAATHAAAVTGTLNVLVAARDAGVRRVIYAGSSSAYGDTEVLPKREDMAPQPRSPYAAAKLAGELYCQVFSRTYGLETVILRYFNVFGERQDPASPYGAVIPKLITCARTGVPPVIHGDGEQTRDFTYVANVVQANLLACAAAERMMGPVFNVGCGRQTSVNTLWAWIRSLTEASVEPIHGPPRGGDVRDSLAALDRIRSVLGYEPAVGIREGLRRMLASPAYAGRPARVGTPVAAP